MVVSDLHLILGLNVCFCTWANSPLVPIHPVRVVDAWHEHRATRRTAQSCRRRPGGGHAVAGGERATFQCETVVAASIETYCGMLLLAISNTVNGNVLVTGAPRFWEIF